MEPIIKKVLKVFDKDGLYKSMAVESRTTAGEVCEKLGKKYFMKEGDMDQFGLFFFEGGVKQSLKMTDFPFDYIVKNEKKEYKFYFLNSKGEFMSFQERVASQLTSAATGGRSGTGAPTREPPQPSGGAPTRDLPQPKHKESQAAPLALKPTKGMSGYLLRKKANKFDKVWAVSRDNHLCFYHSEDDSVAILELSLENAIIELKVSSLGSFIVVTLANSERHTLAADAEGDLQAWATELQATTAYTAVQVARVATPAMAFVPTSRDLNAKKLNVKLECGETQSHALVAWTDYLVSGRGVSSNGGDIMTIYGDGLILINVIDELFNKPLKYRKGKSVYEMQYNIDAVLEALKSVGADFGKLLSQDIVECKVAKVLHRLIWSIFISFVSNGEKEYIVKDKLIGWCGQKVLEVNKSIIIDSPSALSNPLAFAALLSKHRPGSIDMQSVSSKKNKVDQAQAVLDAAYNTYQIPKLLPATAWSEDQMDERSFMLYLSFYYYAMSNESSSAKGQIYANCTSSKPAIEPETVISARDKQLKVMREKDEEEKKKKQEFEEERKKKIREEEEKRKRDAEADRTRVMRESNSQKAEEDKKRQDADKERQARLVQARKNKERAEEEQRERLRKQREQQEQAEREEREAREREERELRELEEQEELERLEEEERLRLEEEEEIARLEEEERSIKQQADEQAQIQHELEVMRRAQEEQDQWEHMRRQQEQEEQDMKRKQEKVDQEQNKIKREKERLQLEQEEKQLEEEKQQQKPSGGALGTRLVNERASIINIFDKLDEELSSSLSFSKSKESDDTSSGSNNHITSNSNISLNDSLRELSSLMPSPPSSPRKLHHSSSPPKNHHNNSNNNNNSPPPQQSPPLSPRQDQQQQQPDGAEDGQNRGKVVVRICLEGFGDVLFCSFAIGYDTLCGKVRQMVVKKMKVPTDEEPDYSLHIVRDGLERVLDDDEILLEAEDRIDRFVFKKNDLFDRRSMISSHRG